MYDFFVANLEHNFILISQIIQTFAVVSGAVLFLASFFEFKRLGEARSMMHQYSAIKPVMLLLCGSVLLVFPVISGTLLISFWGQMSDLSYSSDTSGVGALMPAIFMFVRLVGLVSFMRGLLLLSRASGSHGQPGTVGKALIHMFAGVLCLHVVETMDLLGNILGVV